MLTGQISAQPRNKIQVKMTVDQYDGCDKKCWKKCIVLYQQKEPRFNNTFLKN